MRREFHCSMCNAPAGAVNLTTDRFITIDGPVGVTHFGASEELKAKVAAMLHQPSELELARQLYALDELWAPQYCPNCDAIYCKDHWQIEMRFEDDDDLPGWYDAAYGACPCGHTRMVDD